MVRDKLYSGEKLSIGEKLVSENGKFELIFKKDGNLVMYPEENKNAIWATGTNNKDADTAILQKDGNFVIYAKGKPLWDAGTTNLKSYFLIMQHDGNLVIYNTEYKPIWATNTPPTNLLLDSGSIGINEYLAIKYELKERELRVRVTAFGINLGEEVLKRDRQSFELKKDTRTNVYKVVVWLDKNTLFIRGEWRISGKVVYNSKAIKIGSWANLNLK